MTPRRLSRSRALALSFTAAVSVGAVVAAPIAQAAPVQTVPQQPGYTITGYNVGKGNYRGAIDAQTGDLWLSNASPLSGASESSILQLDPNTMHVKKRIKITRKVDTGGHGTIAAAYDINVPKTGNTVWTTGAPASEVSVWDKNTGKELKTITGVDHAHEVQFAEGLGVAMVSTKPGAVEFFDLNTFAPLGEAKFPVGGQQLGSGIAVTDDGPSGATITVTSYYSALTQFRITRDGGGVQSKVLWNTRQAGGSQGHGSIVADTRTNRVYVNDLYGGRVAAYDLRTGKHIADVTTGPSTNSMMIFHGKVYAANYFAGYISVIDQKTLGVTRLITTGLMPNQLVPWKKNTFLVVDKASSVAELAGSNLGVRSAPTLGTDHVSKVTTNN
ncbi:MAG: hypothetical protein QM774_13215 [Gordonia sp. (in: high G+C Gram-positive bacteria)]|uniref:YncE family protein n=1 Tax=Gordonia sp. (in: high G+C Gram-positive bacteria) TaxID=84139 RepID=UPI0039E4EB48